jgi:phage terminase small subunit
MPNTKLNIRQERFCLGLAEGLPQSRAYIEAGYTARGNAAEVAAARLFRKVQVSSRVAELQAKAARRSEVTVDSLVEELDEMLQLATRQKLPAAGVAAIMGKARLLGLVVDKTEVATIIRKPARSPTTETQMSLEEWQAKFTPKRVNWAGRLMRVRPARHPKPTKSFDPLCDLPWPGAGRFRDRRPHRAEAARPAKSSLP